MSKQLGSGIRVRLEAMDPHYTAVRQERTGLRERTESDKRLKKRLIEIEVSLLSWIKIFR